MDMQTTLEPKLKTKPIDRDVDALKHDFESLKKNVSSLMTSMKDVAGEQASAGAEKGKQLAEDAAKQAVSLKDSFAEQIREKPLTSVGVAVGVGALIAILSRR